MNVCVLIFYSNGIKKEVIYNDEKQCDAEFVDRGNIVLMQANSWLQNVQVCV